MNAASFRELCDQIGWAQHGGSGFSFTRADMLAMSAADLFHHARKANENRAREAKAIAKAHGGAGRTIESPV